MTQHVYGDGQNSTSGANTIRHFYDRAGIKAANRVNVFQQFADKRQMPPKYGKKFKTSKWLHMYDRKPGDPAFGAKGFLSSRSVDDVSAALSGARLAEGAGATNKRVLSKVTVETNVNRYGEMIDYTDEVDLFSEDEIQTRYREELGELANARHEDLIMQDMLSTGTVLLAGPAASMTDIGVGVEADGTNDANYRVSYDLIRKASRKLLRNRAKKNNQIVTGSTKIGTSPISSAYYAVIGAEVKADLEILTRGSDYEKSFAFIPASRYAAASNLAEGEIGAMHDSRFIEAEAMATYESKGALAPADYTGSLSTSENTDGKFYVQNVTSSQIDTSALLSNKYSAIEAGEILEVDDESEVTALTGEAGVEEVTERFDVYPILYPTQGSYATVGLKGKNKIQFHSSAPTAINNENPYGTRGFFSYNFFFAGIILEEEKLLKVLVAASK